jgi:predicted RecB family nuclease
VHIQASDVYDYYHPSRCARRVALRARGEPETTADSPFDKLLQDLGRRHEKAHLAALSGVLDLSSLMGDSKERERCTLAAIGEGVTAIYQPLFRTQISLDGERCELVGEPDFLVNHPDGAGYVIRDSKLARKPTSGRHLAIPLQLQIYGLLYERAAGELPRELQIHAGAGDIVRVPYAGQAPVIEALREHRRMRLASPDAYEPVGWTKCSGCGFHDRCWGEATASGDVALLTTVNQDRARSLHARGIATIEALPAAIDDAAHFDFFWEGKTESRIRGFVPALRRSAEAFLSGKPVVIAAPDLPDAGDCVMLDLEGLPPYLDELEKIYLWGVKDYRGFSPRFLPALAGFGPEGDRAGWDQFLAIGASLLAERPNLRFVHWGNYEQTKIRDYMERYFEKPSGSRIAGHPEASHPEASHREAGHPETSRPEASHPEAGHREASHPEASHPEASHREASHPEASHSETSRPEAGHPEASRPQASHSEERSDEESRTRSAEVGDPAPNLWLPLAGEPSTQGEELLSPFPSFDAAQLPPAPSGTAARILERLVDLLTVVKASVVLPLPSYGLKVVEQLVGFERRLTEYQGNLAMARYIEACETSDPATREDIMSEILTYNEEDLDATRAVMEWLRQTIGRPRG